MCTQKMGKKFENFNENRVKNVKIISKIGKKIKNSKENYVIVLWDDIKNIKDNVLKP